MYFGIGPGACGAAGGGLPDDAIGTGGGGACGGCDVSCCSYWSTKPGCGDGDGCGPPSCLMLSTSRTTGCWPDDGASHLRVHLCALLTNRAALPV